MEWHFGYNCKHFLPLRARAAADDGVPVRGPDRKGQPPFQKCRKLIDSYRMRDDLIEQKWLDARELFVYVGLSREELLRQIASGEIKTKLQKDGKATFGVSTSWRYDDCFLATSGGQCLYFEKHHGKTISYLTELKSLDTDHPNVVLTPSEEDLRAFEDYVIRIIGAA
jgi:hypothetical protein